MSPDSIIFYAASRTKIRYEFHADNQKDCNVVIF